jgi:hypothetical protein
LKVTSPISIATISISEIGRRSGPRKKQSPPSQGARQHD